MPVGAVIAGIGLVTGVIGGMQADQNAQAAADASAEAAKMRAEYNWKETEDQHDWSLYEIEVAKANEANVIALKETVAIDDWVRGMQIRDAEYQSRVAAYNNSEKAYAQQVDYNAMSAQLALEDQDRWLADTALDLQYQATDLAIQDAESTALHGLNLSKMLSEYNLTSQALEAQQLAKRADAIFKGTSAEIKKTQAVGQARASGQAGRSARKNVQAILAQSGFNKAALIDTMTRSENSHRLEQLKNQDTYTYGSQLESTKYRYTQEAMDLGYKKIKSSMSSAFAQDKGNRLKIAHDQYGADLAADARRLSEPTKPPALPIPYEIPETIFTTPRKPSKPPTPASAPNLGSPNTFAAASRGLMNLGSAVSSMQQPDTNDQSNTPQTPPSGGGSYSGGSYGDYNGVTGNPYSGYDSSTTYW